MLPRKSRLHGAVLFLGLFQRCSTSAALAGMILELLALPVIEAADQVSGEPLLEPVMFGLIVAHGFTSAVLMVSRNMAMPRFSRPRSAPLLSANCRSMAE